jgi:hypothetical protein
MFIFNAVRGLRNYKPTTLSANLIIRPLPLSSDMSTICQSSPRTVQAKSCLEMKFWTPLDNVCTTITSTAHNLPTYIVQPAACRWIVVLVDVGVVGDLGEHRIGKFVARLTKSTMFKIFDGIS